MQREIRCHFACPVILCCVRNWKRLKKAIYVHWGEWLEKKGLLTSLSWTLLLSILPTDVNRIRQLPHHNTTQTAKHTCCNTSRTALLSNYWICVGVQFSSPSVSLHNSRSSYSSTCYRRVYWQNPLGRLLSYLKECFTDSGVDAVSLHWKYGDGKNELWQA